MVEGVFVKNEGLRKDTKDLSTSTFSRASEFLDRVSSKASPNAPRSWSLDL